MNTVAPWSSLTVDNTNGRGVPVLHSDAVQPLVNYAWPQRFVLRLHEEQVPAGNDDGWMIPGASDVQMYSSMACHLGSDRE